MQIEVKLPEELEEGGDVLDVFVSVGDVVEADQGLIEIETDKATTEVPSSHAGKITEIRVSEGDTLPAGGTILVLEVTADESSPANAPASPEPISEQQADVAPAPPEQPEEESTAVVNEPPPIPEPSPPVPPPTPSSAVPAPTVQEPAIAAEPSGRQLAPARARRPPFCSRGRCRQ